VQYNVKHVFLSEFGGDVPYFNSTLNAMEVYQKLVNTGRFNFETRVGTSPRTITIFSFA
jgi:hypothetical protein